MEVIVLSRSVKCIETMNKGDEFESKIVTGISCVVDFNSLKVEFDMPYTGNITDSEIIDEAKRLMKSVINFQ